LLHWNAESRYFRSDVRLRGRAKKALAFDTPSIERSVSDPNSSLVVTAILLSVLAVMWPLTRRYPFAYAEMLGGRQSRDIPKVFD
jgi:hypothetical protein